MQATVDAHLYDAAERLLRQARDLAQASQYSFLLCSTPRGMAQAHVDNAFERAQLDCAPMGAEVFDLLIDGTRVETMTAHSWRKNDQGEYERVEYVAHPLADHLVSVGYALRLGLQLADGDCARVSVDTEGVRVEPARLPYIM